MRLTLPAHICLTDRERKHRGNGEFLRAGLTGGVSSTSGFVRGELLKKRRPSSHILEVLSYNLRRLRLARGLTQYELAVLCKLSPSYVGEIEQETVNITLANQEALISGLGCSMADLFMPLPKVRASPSEEADITGLRSVN